MAKTLVMLFTLAVLATASALAEPAAQPLAEGFGKPGKVTIDAKRSVDTPTGIVYYVSHLVTDNGSTLDSAQLRVIPSKDGSTAQKVVASGNVKGTFTQALTKRFYTVYADEAVYDPKKEQIDLSGVVRILIESPYTKGPLVQTGTSAIVKLGSGPDFPTITTNDVKTVFTLN